MSIGPTDPVKWLYDLQHSGMKLGLTNIRQLLDCLGRPEERFTPVLIAGTNGKGSVTAMLDAMLLESGVRSGMFTSPHLVRLNERIRIDGRDIPTGDLHRQLNHVRRVIDRGVAAGEIETRPSFFETIAAAAIQELHDREVKVGLLEIGLGGRLDATNAVAAALSVIVSIDYDHTKNLGPTLEEIAGEKGGIIKEGKPLVCAVAQEAPRKVLRKMAAERNARFVDVLERSELLEQPDEGTGYRADRRTGIGATRRIRPAGGGIRTIRTGRQQYPGLRLSLPGDHQWHNARTAVVALEELASILGFEVDPGAVARGLAATRWAGRLQTVPGEPAILLDGAHNPAGVTALTEHLERRPSSAPRPVLLFGATREKDLDKVLAPLAPYVDGLVASRPDIHRAMEPERIQEYAAGRFEPVLLRPEADEALAAARKLAGRSGLVLVAGSLYLVGRVLSLLEEESCPENIP